MNVHCLAGLFVFLLGLAAPAQVLWAPKISVTQLADFNRWILQNAPQAKLICSEIREEQRLILCVSKTSAFAASAFTRAAFWAEANFGIPHHTLFSTTDPNMLRRRDSPSGFDFSGNDLIEFAAIVQRRCANDKSYCWTPEEADFFNGAVRGLAAQQAPFAVITYNLDDSNWFETARHEVAHGQYFMSPCYRETVDQLWSQVMTAADRMAVISNLRPVFSNEYPLLIRNEFQAFLLVNPGQFISLGMTARLRPVLLENLQSRGCPSLQGAMSPAKGRSR